MTSAFISYSTDNRGTAKRLHDDLREMGVDVFQFEESSVPGSPAWDQVAKSIKTSDWFLLLISQSSNESKAVQEELRFAHYFQLNSEELRPTMVPLMLEAVAKPDLIISRTELPFGEYEDGLTRLRKLFNIDATPEPTESTGVKRTELAAKIQPSARKVEVGETVFLKVTVHNKSDHDLSDVVIRLSNSIISGPIPLTAGERTKLEVPIRIRRPGKTTRTIRVTATDAQAGEVTTSARTNVLGRESESAPALEPELPSSALVDSSALESMQRPSEESYAETSVWKLLAVVLSIGTILTWLTFIAGESLVPWARNTEFPGWLTFLPNALQDWPSWIAYLIAIGLGLSCIGIGVIIADVIYVIEVPDALWATLGSAVVGALIGALWAYVIGASIDDPGLVRAIGGGAALGVFGVSAHLVLDKFDEFVVILLMGAVLIAGAYIGADHLVSVYRGLEYSGWAADLPNTLSAWAGWVKVLIAIVLGIVSLIGGFLISDDILIVDGLDAFWGTFRAALVGAVIGVVWALLFGADMADSSLVFIITGGTGLGVMGVVLDEVL